MFKMHSTPKNKGFKTWLVSEINFQRSVLRRTFLSSKEPLSNVKNLLFNGNVPWMLKVLHGTINAKKEKN